MKNLIFIVCFLMILGGIITFANRPHAEIYRPSDKEIIKLFKDIEEKLHGKYNIGTSSLASNPDYSVNEIIIEIYGNQKYYDSVNEEIKMLVQNIIKSTPFENYSIKPEISNIQQLLKEKGIQEPGLINDITKNLYLPLSQTFPDQVEEIIVTKSPPDSPPELFIEIKTLINEHQRTNISEEMEDAITMILKEQLSSHLLVKVSSIKIHIYNKDGEKIN
ncbi:hypothetical protein [Lysinibacillus sp. SGAir0095]|uniref:hypothetical protein n=1 Tax=Lysinibacillus sp. SGAir0095 TaxID=2070463 RepID=UPI0010CD0128|nr:hypothetical protein [Lysinibacillus sp. SGAir0095]QCR31960.1 hypothetical protein C1N55_07135 [Lysinibacillus sp. SGAir0095]